TNDVASFTTTILATDSSQFDVAWKLFTVPLTAYAGQDIYIAFHEHVANNTIEGDVIGLDMVTINSPLSPVAQCSPLSWDAGNVTLASSETSGNFTLSNTGAGTLTCSSINGLNAPFTTSLIPANVSLTAGGSLTFTFSYNPVIMGTDNQTVVIATNGGNVSISLSGNGVTGIGEQDINVTAIYPNPVSDILHIAVRGEKSIEIYNLIGEMVASHRNMDEVNISGLSVGTYIVKVITGSKIHTGKFSIIR
ncbi:MAG TPA: T9SS type A sorting domain-containing protein, partial [Bacteroidales bacterium]|nr:T9SS type A sorting domain-containing protein [Bacteroidales bacterium]